MKSWAKWFADRVAVKYTLAAAREARAGYGNPPVEELEDGVWINWDDGPYTIAQEPSCWRDQLRFETECDRDRRNGVDGQHIVGDGEPIPALDPELMRLTKKWVESF